MLENKTVSLAASGRQKILKVSGLGVNIKSSLEDALLKPQKDLRCDLVDPFS